MTDIDATSNEGVKRRRYVVEQYIPVYSNKNFGKKVASSDIWESIFNWPERSQVWPLVYSPLIVGALAGLNGYYVNNSLRSYLYINQTGRLLSYFATTVLPAGTAALIHHFKVSGDIVEGKTKCPVCVQVRAASFQLAAGSLYPGLMAPIALFPILSKMKKSLRLPNIVSNPRDVLKYFGEIFSPLRRPLLYFAAAHMVISMGITYLEQESYYTNIAPMIRITEQKSK